MNPSSDPAMTTAYQNSMKPREEYELTEMYPDLAESVPMPVFFVMGNTECDREDGIGYKSGKAFNSTSGILNLKTPTFKKITSTMSNATVKFNKQLQEFGFQEPSKINSKNKIQDTYIRPFEIANTRNTNKNASDSEIAVKQFLESKQMLVEYDMDEQDFLFLQARNKKTTNVVKITPEVFEILISALETEWTKLEHTMNSMTGGIDSNGTDSSKKLLTMGHNNEMYGNDDGIEPGSIYDQRCAVCNDSDCDNTNAIVFCDGCDIAVHQECYGVAFIPEGSWLCRKCMINKNKSVTECVFCPSTTGAFKQLDNSLWSHVVCALWINELYFANPIYMEPIEGIDAIPKSRWKLACYICKQRVGACIQCANRNCFLAYHVTCAKRAGLYMEMTQGMKGALTNKLTLKSFCEKHSPPLFDTGGVTKGIERTRRYFRDTKILKQENAKLKTDQKIANKLNVFKWKTEQGTPIAPKLFSDVLVGLMYKLKVENQVSLPEESSSQVLELSRLPNRTKEDIYRDLRNIANEMCRYWCLKRESKNGAPLVRRNNNLMSANSIVYDSNNLENDTMSSSQIAEKIGFANLLIDDIEKLISINGDNIGRQEYLAAMELLNLEIVKTAYFPLRTFIETVVNSLRQRYDFNGAIFNYKPKDASCKSLLQILAKNDRFSYHSIEEFQSDINSLSLCVFAENRPSFMVYKQMKKWKRDFDERVKSVEFRDGDIVQYPRLNLCGTETTFKEPSYRRILDENELSEVEDDEIESEESKKLLTEFLAK